ncbi:MAG: hypothetical protein SFW65_10695 [Alphaproteobacteria bacterium]|nr:hypothetical protein [Alphaproteobacteria bacterium]
MTSMKERLLGRIAPLSAKLGKMGSQVFTSATALRQEIESLSIERLERLARNLNLAKRNEFESLQAMVKEMRNVQEEIRTRLDVLERAAGINSSLRNKSTSKKSSGKSPVKSRANSGKNRVAK